MDFGRQMEDSTDEAGRSQQSVMDAIQLPLIPGPHQTNQTMGNSSSLLPNGITPQFTPHFNPHQLHHHQHAPQQHMQRPDQQLQLFWANQLQEIRSTTDFKNHNLPLARIKKIMKADEDVKMIAAEAPVLFSRACEMFILELTYRSWDQAEHSKRRTLQKSDIAAAIAKNQIFDFLVDIVPMAEVKETGELPIPGGEELSETIPYYYDPSRFGSMMMDVRHTEMESQGLAYIQPSREDCLPQQMQEQKHAT